MSAIGNVAFFWILMLIMIPVYDCADPKKTYHGFFTIVLIIGELLRYIIILLKPYRNNKNISNFIDGWDYYINDNVIGHYISCDQNQVLVFNVENKIDTWDNCINTHHNNDTTFHICCADTVLQNYDNDTFITNFKASVANVMTLILCVSIILHIVLSTYICWFKELHCFKKKPVNEQYQIRQIEMIDIPIYDDQEMDI